MKTYYVGILAILLLAGCAGKPHMLVKDEAATFTGGQFIHDRGKDNLLVLESSGRRYEARGFVVERQTNLAELRKRYRGVNPKHWQRIASGLDRDHVIHSTEAIAKSSDGRELTCSILWKSREQPAGECTDKDRGTFPVRFD